MNRKYLLLYLMLTGLLVSCSLFPGKDEPLLEERIQRVENGLLLNRSIQERMKAHQVPGLSIAVVNDFELEWTRSYGVMKLGESQPVTPQTLFQAGSVAKPVTSVTALHFVESGLLELDEDVNAYLNTWKVPENEYTAHAPVTLRGLLSHTAGINQGLNRGYAPGEEVPSLLQALEGVPPANTLPVRVDRIPGTESYYSNGGYLVVVQLLQDILGMPFAEITRETLFDPLGMTSSTFEQNLPEDLELRTATPHGWDVESWREVPGLIAEVHIHDPGYAGLWTTAEDLARFGQEIMLAYEGRSNQVISQRMARQITEPVFEDVPMQAPYDVDIGLGFDLLHLGSETLLIHFGGSFPGYTSVLLFQPERGFGVAILTNSFTGYELIWEILYSIFYAYGIFPTAGQLGQIALSAGVFLGALILLVRGAGSWNASLQTGAKDEFAGNHHRTERQAIGMRIFLFLVAAVALTITLRFRGPWGGYQVHPLWKGAPWSTKLCLGGFFTSGLILLSITIKACYQNRWSSHIRIYISLLVLGILAVMFLLRDLWTVMFWG